jgi:hypothetical protein
MALPVRKGYTGNGVQTTLSSLISNVATTVTVTTAPAVANWPSTFPFFVVVDPGTSTEEKMKVTAVGGSNLTVVRGADNTTNVGHDNGAVIYPVFTASEASEANEIASAMTTKGDLIATDGSTINRLAVGATNTHVLQVDSTATNGFKWGQVATAGIADDAVTTAKIAPNTIVQGDVATALLKLVCPVGTISAYPGATAPAGWLLCTGVSTTGYTELIDLVGATTPNLQGKVLVGKGSAPFDGALLSSFGSTTSTAPHTHSGSTLTAVSGGSHDHTYSGTTNAESQDHVHAPLVVGFSLAPGATSVVATGPGGGADAAYNTAGKSTTHNHTYSGTTTSHAGHVHTITGDTGASSASATHGNVQPSTIINYIIKHDY